MKLLPKLLIMLLIIPGAGERCFAQKQGQALIDSLLQKLPAKKEDTNKIKLLVTLSFTYYSINPDEGIKYGQQGLELSEKLQWKKGISGTNSALGTNYMNKSDYPKALECYLNALKVYEEVGNKKGTASTAGNIGLVCFYQSNYPEALEYFSKSLKMYQELGDKAGAANAVMNIGNVYNHQSNYSMSLEYYFKALKTYEELGNKQNIANANDNIGSIYYIQHDYQNALEHFSKSIKIAEELGDKIGAARFYGNAGNVYDAQSDYAKALEYYFKALKLDEDAGNKDGLATIAMNIGTTYTKQKNYAMAITYCQKALQTDEALGDRYSTAWALYRIGNAYLSLVADTAIMPGKIAVAGELPEAKYRAESAIPAGKEARLHNAIMYMQRGLDTAKKIHVADAMQACYEGLAKAYKLNGDYRQGMENYEAYTAVKDSVFSKDNEKQILKLGMQNEYEKQRYADSMKVAAKEKLDALQLQRQRSYTYMGITGALLLLGFSFFMLRNNKLLGREKQRSEDLLLNILPAEVAGELKDKGSSAARHYDHVTVLFTDFVNFTQAGEKMSAQALIDELHTCFKAFDEITAAYKIEKIKTIGDAYLAVSGLPAADAKHAENVVRAAREIRDFMGNRYARLGDRTFEVRIGIHSGSVVAGIVGVKKFAYDIWGDTVNTAARMEENSEAGRVNISQVTYELVKDKFTCTYRGEIEAKNKGGMKMYFVD